MSVLAALGPVWPAVGTRLGSAILNPVLNVLSTSATYNANNTLPIIIPGPGELLECIARGIYTTNEINTELRYHGIDIGTSAWPGVLRSMNLCPSPEVAVQSFWRDRVTEPTAKRWIKAGKITQQTETDFLWSKPYIWNAQTARVLNAIGVLNVQDYEKWLRAAGLLLQEDRDTFHRLYQVPTHEDVMESYRRGDITQQIAREYLKRLGFTNPDVLDALFKLSVNLPTPSDLVNFSVKEVWDQSIVNQFGYDDEFSQLDQYRAWMGKLGYSGSPDAPGNPPSGMQTWAQAYWRSHWRNVSPSQAYAMLHRLRPTGGPNGGPRVPFVPGTNNPVAPFSIGDVANVLKVNDYPTAFRQRLAAISYAVLRLVDVRRVVVKSSLSPQFKQDAIGPGVTIKDWAKEQHLDRGNSPENAEILAKMNVADGEAAFNAMAYKYTKRVWAKKEKRIAAQYSIGGITKPFAVQQFTQIGWPISDASDYCDEIDKDRAIKCTMQNMAAVKTKIMAGKITAIQGYQWLLNVGLLPARAQWWINCWRGLLMASSAQIPAQSALQEYSQGLLTKAETVQVLANLGFQNPEVAVNNQEIKNLTNG